MEVRTLTLEEEIGMLTDENLKGRLMFKYRLEKEEEKLLYERLDNCHHKIKVLERALVEQAVIIGSIADDRVY